MGSPPRRGHRARRRSARGHAPAEGSGCAVRHVPPVHVGKLVGTKVALVSVGANRMNQRLTRWLFHVAAGAAYYRSYRDSASREAMRQGGLDVSEDPVYPDLVLGLPVPNHGPGDVHDRRRRSHGLLRRERRSTHAEEMYASYVESMKRFIWWLVDSGHKVRLFWGDNKESIDGMVVQEILEGPA